jgi:hypothetical protein
VTMLATLPAEWAALTASPTVDRALDVLRADPALAVPDLPALLVATRTPLTRSATTCALLGAADPTTPAGRIATRVLVQAYLPAVAAMARDRRVGADPGDRCSTALTGLLEAIAAAPVAPPRRRRCRRPQRGPVSRPHRASSVHGSRRRRRPARRGRPVRPDPPHRPARPRRHHAADQPGGPRAAGGHPPRRRTPRRGGRHRLGYAAAQRCRRRAELALRAVA